METYRIVASICRRAAIQRHVSYHNQVKIPKIDTQKIIRSYFRQISNYIYI